MCVVSSTWFLEGAYSGVISCDDDSVDGVDDVGDDDDDGVHDDAGDGDDDSVDDEC